MDELHVEFAGLVQGPANRFLGDLVEDHPLDGNLRREELEQVLLLEQLKVLSTVQV